MLRHFVAVFAFAVLPAGAQTVPSDKSPGGASAAFPTKPIRFVYTAASGPTDGVGRALAASLSERFRQQVLSDGRSGANGIIATDLVAKAPPDGYTVLMSTGSFAINPTIYEKLPYDPQKDFAPISLVATSGGLLLVTHPSLPPTTLKAFIALAKARPNEITYGSAGVGNTTHMAGELFNLMAGTRLNHVPYKGAAPALTDVLGGHISAMFPSLVIALPHVKSGKLRALGLTAMTRTRVLQDVPTLDEQGLKGFDIAGWFALFAPARVPKDVITFYQQSVVAVLKDPQLREKLEGWGLTPVGGSPEQLAALVKKEMATYGRIVKEAKIPKS